MSAPILSAAAAMLHSYAGGLSAAEMKEILLSTADAQENLSGYVGTGARLNVGTALSYAREHYEELTAEDLPFTDLEKTDSAYEAVRYLYENGIMLGTSETAFSPDSGLNRAMAVTLLGRLAQAEQQETDLFFRRVGRQPGTADMWAGRRRTDWWWDTGTVSSVPPIR